ncbi:hypothetical protein T492DRAFT_1104472 [Pavlovales sp. CCMP2436]|nr:hypothetical protein T492DRAFT_1104472 [Pavlovales sp. CCMP2436]
MSGRSAHRRPLLPPQLLLLLAPGRCEQQPAGGAADLFSGLAASFRERADRPPMPPAGRWAAPPSTPPPTVYQRFESDSAYRCRAMGIVELDRPGCCETEGAVRYCCQPCRLVWLNVTSSGLSARGSHYRVEQCLPLRAARVRVAALCPQPPARRQSLGV